MISKVKKYYHGTNTYLLQGVDEINIFTAYITEKNEAENVKFKKSLEYAVTGLLINQDVGSALVTVTDIDRLNFLDNSIQKLVKEKRLKFRP